MVAADTNFLVRLITNEPKQQAAEAKKILKATGTRGLLIDRVIIAESIYVLRSNYRWTREDAVTMITSLLSGETFTFSDEALSKAMLRILLTTRLSPEDACLAALVQTGKVNEVATFDQALRKYVRKSQG